MEKFFLQTFSRHIDFDVNVHTNQLTHPERIFPKTPLPTPFHPHTDTDTNTHSHTHIHARTHAHTHTHPNTHLPTHTHTHPAPALLPPSLLQKERKKNAGPQKA
jgi:hypothetical protein